MFLIKETNAFFIDIQLMLTLSLNKECIKNRQFLKIQIHDPSNSFLKLYKTKTFEMFG